MAFGAGNGDITIRMVLDAAQASGDAKKFLNDFQTGVKNLSKVNSQLNKEIKDVGTAAVAAGKGAEQAFGKAGGAIGKFTEGLSAITLAKQAISFIADLAKAVDQLVEDAGRIEGLTSSFKALQSAAGELSGVTLKNLRANTQGYVSDAQLMQKANQALLLGLPNDKFVELTGDAVKLGRAMGIDATAAVESLTLGIGRQSKLILDNLGIIVDAETAYRNYATANSLLGQELDDSQKKLAFQEEAFRKIKERADELPAAYDTAATAQAKYSATLENNRAEIAKGVNENEALIASIKLLEYQTQTSKLPAFFADVGAYAKAGFNFATIAANEFGNAILPLGYGADSLRQKFENLYAAMGNVSQSPLQQFISSATTSIQGFADTVKNKAVSGVKSFGDAVADSYKAQKKIVELTDSLSSDFLGVDPLKSFNKGDADKIRSTLADIYKTQKSGAITNEEAAKRIKEFGLSMAKSTPQVEDFGKVAKRVLNDTKKSIDEAARAGKKATSDANRDLKSQERELEQFAKTVGDAFETSVPKEFAKAIEDAFTLNVGDPAGIVSAIQKIGVEAQKAGVSLNSLSKVVKDKQDLSVLGPGNDAGLADFKNNKKSTKDFGTILGFDTGFSKEVANQIEGALSQAFQLVAQSITSGVNRQDIAGIGAALGASIGTAIGGPIGGAIGNLVGQIGGQFAAQIGKDTSGTKARKAADKYFADIFNADRLSVVIGGEIKRIEDLVFNPSAGGGKNGLFGAAGEGIGTAVGLPPGIGTAIGSRFSKSGPDSFADGSFDDGLAAASASTQSFFNAVGTSFEQLLGVSEEISGQIAAVLFNNIGGSLENLQALVQSTGRSFEEMGDALFQAFFNGDLGVQQLQESLVRLNQIFQIGIPDQIGALDQAARSFQLALADDKGSRILFNSLRSIGAEAQEVGKGLGDVAASLAQALGLGADKVALLLQAMKLSGINSIDELVKAGNEKLAALGANIQTITQGGTPTSTAVTVPTNSIASTVNFTPLPAAVTKSSSGTNKAADEAKRKLEALRQETIRLVTASTKYKDILAGLENGLLKNGVAGNKIKELYQQQFKNLERLQTAQENYDKALAKGVGGEKLAALVRKLKEAQDAVDKLSQTTTISKLDFSGITAAIKSLDQLGVVANIAGITVQTTANILNAEFLRGKISITEYNSLLATTNDLLGKGIPGAVGAFNQAFNNIAKAGRDGGVYLTDAIGDVAAEFEEFFGKNGSERRKTQLATLTSSFDEARNALQQGINAGASIEEVDKLTRKFEGAKKALADFRDTSPKPELEDLRSELQKTFTPGQVDIYFEALRENGINSFDDLKGASNDLLVSVAGTLDKLGFNFSDTDKSIRDLINSTNDAVKKAAGGQDPLDAALVTVRDLASATNLLPPIYSTLNDNINVVGGSISNLPALVDNTGKAITNLDGPMKTLKAGFDSVLGTLGQLTGEPFNTTVLLNVKALYEGQAENLVDLMFGKGNGVIPVGTTGPGTGGGLSDRQKERRLYLQGLVNRGQKLSAAQLKQLNSLNRLAG